jgi:biotin operon repressor
MFMPNIRIDLNEKEYGRPKKTETLIPSAQYIMLYQILKRDNSLEQYTFKDLAQKLGYSAMAITKAVNNLKAHKLCEIEGSKEKYVRFNGNISELWYKALPLMTSPVLKQVYIEKYPEGELLFPANTSALPEYTDMNPSKQEYFAIEKNKFYKLEKENKLQGLNEFEGRYCLEIWKYNPFILMEDIAKEAVVDPLSLYLSFTNNQDERIEMALEQIIKKYIW